MTETEDPVAPIAARIIKHMREDHLDSLLDICQAFCAVPDGTSADMTSIDRDGFDALVQTPGGEKRVRFDFETRVQEGSEVRGILTDLAHRAEDALGKGSSTTEA